MKRFIRAAVVVGAGLLAGAAFGAGQAQAAGNTAAGSHHTGIQAHGHWGDNSDVVGYFSSPRTCERVGRIGEFRDRWEDYDCYRVRWGFHRGTWALEVDYGFDNNNWDNNDGDWHGNHGDWHGQHGDHGDWHGHGPGIPAGGGAVVFPLGPGA